MEIPVSSSNALLIALPAVLLLGACSSHPAPERKKDEAPPIRAQVVKAVRQDVPDLYEATGTVRARVTTVLSARLMGHIREIRPQVGDSVKPGQVVAVIDAREIETALRQAEAGRQEARGALPEVDNAIAAAKAQLDLATSTFHRMKSLAEQKSITPQEFDEASARQRMAEANLKMAEAKRTQLGQKIRQADEAVAQVNIQKGYSEVAAPFAGIVTERRAEPGTLAAPGTPLLVVEQAGGYRLEAGIEEARLSTVRAGARAEVKLDAFEQKLSGAVSEIVPALDPASRTFTAKLDLTGGLPLRTGMFGRARFTLGKHPALTVPPGALAAEGQVRKVYVVSEGRARARLVTTGATHEGGIEILSGLAEGEQVVCPLPPGLADGARVEVRE
jgi:RND family efflux transporter MFP subunit